MMGGGWSHINIVQNAGGQLQYPETGTHRCVHYEGS